MSENALTPGSAVWNYIKNSVPAQLGAAGHLAQSVAQPFTNLFGNGGQEFWNGPQDPQAAHDMSNALMTMYAGNAFNPAATVENGLGAGIKAFHGSPYDFDRFDASKIGTGEGAQAYGHGLYFAENEGVAKNYRDMSDATIKGQPFNINFPMHKAVQMADEFGSRGAAISEVNARLARDPDPFLKQVLYHLESSKPLPSMDSVGKMYEVNINADPSSFLDWDKPLAEQSSTVRDALYGLPGVKQGDEFQRGFLGEDKGYTGAAALAKAGNWNRANIHPPEAMTDVSGKLRDAGIPGIRYLDQGSRGAGEGSHNYVVFPGNEHLIEILKKYGIAGAATMLGLSQSDLHSAVFGNGQQPQNALAR